jgi:hypothetical protein
MLLSRKAARLCLPSRHGTTWPEFLLPSGMNLPATRCSRKARVRGYFSRPDRPSPASTVHARPRRDLDTFSSVCVLPRGVLSSDSNSFSPELAV